VSDPAGTEAVARLAGRSARWGAGHLDSPGGGLDLALRRMARRRAFACAGRKQRGW